MNKAHLSSSLCKMTLNLDAHTGPLKCYDIICTWQFRTETQKKHVLSNISERPICEQTRTHTSFIQINAGRLKQIAIVMQHTCSKFIRQPSLASLDGRYTGTHTWSSTAPIHANSLLFRIKSAALGHIHLLQCKHFNSNTYSNVKLEFKSHALLNQGLYQGLKLIFPLWGNI